MARAFRIVPTAPFPVAKTVRLGAGNSPADNFNTFSENLKVVKLVGESRFDLCAAGDEIEGYISAVEQATQDGYTIGSIITDHMMFVRFDGLQATPGTGVVAVGDFVVAGTLTAKGTALADYPKVCKATDQAGQTFKWRVLSLGAAGSGAVGTTGVVERVK